jgi:hypothetical protein
MRLATNKRSDKSALKMKVYGALFLAVCVLLRADHIFYDGSRFLRQSQTAKHSMGKLKIKKLYCCLRLFPYRRIRK